MSIAPDSGFMAAANAPAHGIYSLVELQFRDGSLRLTSWPVDMTALGQTWVGVGVLGNVGEMHESEDGAEEKVTLTLTLADEATRALAMSDPASYQDRPARIWVGLLDGETLQPSGAPILRFAGVMDQLRTEREGVTGKVLMDCRSTSYAARSRRGFQRMTNAQHQSFYPGERGFEYLTSIIGNPAVWMSKRLQDDMTRKLNQR